eukprot:gene5698-biopygen3571
MRYCRGIGGHRFTEERGRIHHLPLFGDVLVRVPLVRLPPLQHRGPWRPWFGEAREHELQTLRHAQLTLLCVMTPNGPPRWSSVSPEPSRQIEIHPSDSASSHQDTAEESLGELSEGVGAREMWGSAEERCG